MMQAVQHWVADNRLELVSILSLGWATRDQLPPPLVRPSVVEVGHILIHDAMQMSFAQDQDVVQALAAHAADEPFTDGIRPWCFQWGEEYFNI